MGSGSCEIVNKKVLGLGNWVLVRFLRINISTALNVANNPRLKFTNFTKMPRAKRV
ncbi:hypothetical protein [Kordia sp.]|uniref:hypothetical protein n=1 Tax=Kordia sp. TaxID=1965332 RepID=UPI003D6C10C3